MKFTIQKSDLQNALNIAGKGIGKNILPILENFLFEFTSDTLKLSGSNLEVFVCTSIPCEADSPLSICVPAARISGLVKDLSDGIITGETAEVEAGGYTLILKAGRGRYSIPCSQGEDFPQMSAEYEASFKLPANLLLQGIDKTLFAIFKDASVNEKLSALSLSIKSDSITFTGCDGFVLSTQTFPTSVSTPIDLLIPAKVLGALQNLPYNSDVNVSVSKRSIAFEINNETTVKSTLVDATYPDVIAIIPVDNPICAKAGRNDFISALKRINQFSDLTTNVVSLSFDSGLLTISAKNNFDEVGTEEIPCELSGNPIEIGVKGLQLLAALAKSDSETLSIHLSDPKRAIVISDSPESKENLILVMPCKL